MLATIRSCSLLAAADVTASCAPTSSFGIPGALVVAGQLELGWLKSLLSSASLSPLTSVRALNKCRSLVDYDSNEEYSCVPISE